MPQTYFDTNRAGKWNDGWRTSAGAWFSIFRHLSWSQWQFSPQVIFPLRQRHCLLLQQPLHAHYGKQSCDMDLERCSALAPSLDSYTTRLMPSSVSPQLVWVSWRFCDSSQDATHPLPPHPHWGKTALQHWWSRSVGLSPSWRVSI